jgi:hypothetical protein
MKPWTHTQLFDRFIIELKMWWALSAPPPSPQHQIGLTSLQSVCKKKVKIFIEVLKNEKLKTELLFKCIMRLKTISLSSLLGKPIWKTIWRTLV